MSRWCSGCARVIFTQKYESCTPECPLFGKYKPDLEVVVLGLDDAVNKIKRFKEEALHHADHAAAGYDEGWYCGEDEGYEKVLELLEPLLKHENEE